MLIRRWLTGGCVSWIFYERNVRETNMRASSVPSLWWVLHMSTSFLYPCFARRNYFVVSWRSWISIKSLANRKYLIGDVLCNMEKRQKGIMLELISILRNSEIAYKLFNKLLSLFDNSLDKNIYDDSLDKKMSDDHIFGSSDEEEDI